MTAIHPSERIRSFVKWKPAELLAEVDRYREGWQRFFPRTYDDLPADMRAEVDKANIAMQAAVDALNINELRRIMVEINRLVEECFSSYETKEIL